MSSLVSSSLYSHQQNNLANNLKPSLSTSTHFQTSQQQQQQQQLLSHSFHGSYYTPSPLSLPSLASQQQQHQQSSPPKSFPVNDSFQKTTSTLALMATTTVSTPTISTSTMTTTISIQQAKTQEPQQVQAPQVKSRALSEPRFQSPTSSTTQLSKAKEGNEKAQQQQQQPQQQIETYDNLTVENDQNENGFKILELAVSNDHEMDKHIYGILETKEQNRENENINAYETENNGIEGENSKLKMMQKQLFDLTNMIHNALLNGDLKQLASIEYNLNRKPSSLTKKVTPRTSPTATLVAATANVTAETQQFSTNTYKKTLNSLLTKIRELKAEYQGVKKLHENFNSNINESMKQFVNKLQVRYLISF